MQKVFRPIFGVLFVSVLTVTGYAPFGHTANLDVTGSSGKGSADLEIINSSGGYFPDPFFSPGMLLGDPHGDSDGDGVVNLMDAFPDDPTESIDYDGDGVGDNADAFPLDRLRDTDTDGDGVDDLADNCPYASNPDQLDENGNAQGDACDLLTLSAP